MRSGELNKLIDIEKPSIAVDGMGDSVQSFVSHVSNVWAAIWPVSAREQIMSSKPELEITHRIRIRYRKNITSDMRIKYGEIYFDIVSIINPGTGNRMLDILATEAQ